MVVINFNIVLWLCINKS
uniref:Uncharacterized protein n=1 Tax=Rhizophora mucronata TaxID=61149 RepID=A0A2P2R4G6_RHIMU